MPAGAATDPSETPGEDAAADEAIELALHQLRHGLSSTCDGGRERRTVMPDRPQARVALTCSCSLCWLKADDAGAPDLVRRA